MKLDDGRLSFVAQQEVTALDAIHKAVLGKAACAGRVTEDVGACISIHAPTWGATADKVEEAVLAAIFQSTHPRGVRLKRDAKILEDFLISIHAPTWGATPYEFRQPPRWLFISIHAPTWGATGAPVVEVAVFHDFNPRTHVGCDIDAWHVCWPSCVFQSTHPRGVRPLRPDGVLPKRIISIHAPTWGATSAASRCSRSGRNFNPRTHVGCDL